eukprot:SAG22_NODE_720_length_7649_cov_16.537616_1_plen_208_part_00
MSLPIIGIPVKLLHESEGHTITVELKTGEVYRGHLVESEDNMNMQLSNVTLTARDGRVSNLEQCFIRGSKVRFMVLPDMLKNAPMFKRIDSKVKGSGGRGMPMSSSGMGRGRGEWARMTNLCRPPGFRPGVVFSCLVFSPFPVELTFSCAVRRQGEGEVIRPCSTGCWWLGSRLRVQWPGLSLVLGTGMRADIRDCTAGATQPWAYV